MKATTASRLSQIMNERNLKQVDILRMSQPYQKQLDIKLSKSALSQYVNNIQSPDQDRIYLLSKVLDVSEPWLMGFDVKKERIPDQERGISDNDINIIYNQLEQLRQQKVYRYAKNQLSEQNNITEFTTREKQQSSTVDCYGAVSAGTGEWLDQEHITEVNYYGEIPEHDFAVSVNGDSMLPMFEDGQLIFVNKVHEARNGQIIIAQLNGESYVKKFVNDSHGHRLVSLNKEYEDIILNDSDAFKIFGVVVL